MSGTTQRPSPPGARVHRIGSAVLGLILWVFAALGYLDGLAYFSTTGQIVMGLSANGLLSTISLVVGAILLLAAARGGPASSMVAMVVGGVFIVSGLAHLAVLGTSANILAFRIPNVIFSLVVGIVLLLLGAYGHRSLLDPVPRTNTSTSTRTATDASATHAPPGSPQDPASTAAAQQDQQQRIDAELAVAEGAPTAEQQEMVDRDRQQRLQVENERIARNMNDERRH